jgi:hypothetical protein
MAGRWSGGREKISHVSRGGCRRREGNEGAGEVEESLRKERTRIMKKTGRLSEEWRMEERMRKLRQFTEQSKQQKSLKERDTVHACRSGRVAVSSRK